MENPRFYAADLAAYNSGRLHGVWVAASSDVEEMQEAIDEMLKASPCGAEAEEWLIHDYDDAAKVISDLGETSDLGEIAERVEGFEEIADDYDETIVPHLVAWLADACTYAHEWKGKLDDAFAGIWNDPEDYAADLAESCGYMTGTDNPVLRYVDFRAMARDMALGGEMDFICTSTGNHLQDYDSMRGRECIALRCF